MLTAQDDLLGHQTPGTFARAGNGDPRFTERYWYTAHPLDGTPWIFDAGVGYYPNRGVMDGFAGVTIGRRQFNFRASRRLGARPLEIEVGPLRLEVDLRSGVHHLTLAENASGLSFDLRFDPTFPAAQEKQSFRERKGEVEEDLARVAQFGRWRGWLVADGKRYELTAGDWWGQRDRSWGIRSEMRTDHDRPPVQTHTKLFWTWSMLQMQHSAVSIFLKEREPGAPYYLSCSEFQRGADGVVAVREATRVEHEIAWADDPMGQTIAHADLRLEFEHGLPRQLRVEGLPARFYLKGGLYGGFGGWNHGDDRGPYHEGHDVWNLDDAAIRERARTLSDHVVRVTSEGDSGIGISEYGVASGYPRYVAPQKFPAL
ncbi:MAG: hypothetical protein JSS14_01605 [Proteobacteria bacterium]|nr:hypothetical protein [Pseudomonadota bacterium]